jgi:hypothetical protein
MRRDHPYQPPDPDTAAGRAEAAVSAAERAVVAAELDLSHRDAADRLLGEALTAMTAFITAIESVQARARQIELTTGRRDPVQAKLAREAHAKWKRAAVHLETLGVRLRKADRRFLRPVNPPGIVRRIIDWMAP